MDVIHKKVGSGLVYIVRFPDRTPGLILTYAAREKGGHFYTSVTEGKQGEAEHIGPKITEHYQKLAAL